MLILRGAYDKKSLVVLATVGAVALASGIVWREYVSLTWEDFDPLLVFCWLLMVGLAAFRFTPRRDLPLAAVAFVGGALIETWGTRSGLWTYFTHEKPPLFILPAWPVAALATERIGRAVARPLARLGDRSVRALHAAALIAFCILLWTWTAPGRAHPTTAVAYGLVAITCASGKTPREDLVRFVAGSLLGWLLEYWGTTRFCWTYWDGRTPPLASVLSHGFATVAFARGVWIAGSFSPRRRARPAAAVEPG